MRSHEVLKLLGVTRPTLTSYIKSGKIKGTKLSTGMYDYDEQSIYDFLGITRPRPDRSNIIYARVSTQKQKQDLANQVLQLIDHCETNDITYTKIYQEVSSGIDFNRKQFSDLLEQVIENKIDNIFITYKDRISRLSFMTLESLFKKFDTNIIVINDTEDSTDEDDLLEELQGIIDLFSMKMYSSQRKVMMKKIKQNIL